MSKLESSDLPPPTMAQLSQGACLSHLDHCGACSLRRDVLRVDEGRVMRVASFDFCPIGKFLVDLWKETQK